MRTGSVILLTLGIAGAMPAAAATVPIIYEAAGADAAGIQPTVDAFRDDLGQLNPNEPQNVAGGRRQINWDAAPDAVSDPNAFPGDFFNFNAAPRARGIEFSTPGDGFQLSSTEASGEPVLFGAEGAFEPFSPERMFTPIGSNTTFVDFFDPANTGEAALSTGLGVIFSDVDVLGSTSMSFFDVDGDLLLERDVLAGSGDGTFSFLGIAFDEPVVARVEITSGSIVFTEDGLPGAVLGPADAVAMDDFIFGEPTPAAVAPVPLPASAPLLPLGFGAMIALRRRRRA